MIQQKITKAAAVAALAALGLTLAGCGSETQDPKTTTAGSAEVTQTANGRHVDTPEFKKAIEEGATIIDVRTSSEYNDGHIPGAVLVDVSSPTFEEEIAKLDKNKAYAIYCRSGNRSKVAAAKMIDAGFTNVIGLSGGIGAWDGGLG